jgi:predicted nucleic acid-binding Zn ribbon protein
MAEHENCTTCGAEYEVVYDPGTPKSDAQVDCDQCGATLQPKPDSGTPAYRLIKDGARRG